MHISYLEKLDRLEAQYHEIEARLTHSSMVANTKEYTRLSKERSSLRAIVDTYTVYKQILKDIASNKELLMDSDADIKKLVQAELIDLELKKEIMEAQLRVFLLPRDPNDEKNIILEIRAGTGGDEASLFAADLFRMFTKYAESKKWTTEVLSSSASGVKGLKEVIVSISGEKVYSHLKYESGVHRVQRVPKTEAQGRIHTSTVSVAVLPEADEVEIDIDPSSIRIDVFRSGGHGGQSVNTTDSAVRITHLPTGLTVSCQDEKSQHKNKAKALKILRSRLYDLETQKQHSERAQNRKQQIGTGDRSEKIRTYNFPQSRVTDHRIGYTVHELDIVLDGHLDDLITRLQNHFEKESLKEEV